MTTPAAAGEATGGRPATAARTIHGAASVAESICVALLGAAAVVAPLALGATAAWPRFALEATLAAAALIWALSEPRPLFAMLVPLGIAGIACLQILPLPDRLLMSLAPISGAAWKVALAEAGGGGWGTIAVHPAATAVGIRRLLLGLVTVFVVADLARAGRWRRWLTFSIAVSGALVWILGLAFPVTPKDRVILGCVDLKGPIEYWLTPLEPPLRTCGVGERVTVTAGNCRYETLDSRAGDGFGPYIYSNHFAGALCLTVPALLAVVMHLMRKRGVPPPAVWLTAAMLAAASVYTSWEIVRSRAGAAALLLGMLVFFTLACPLPRSRRVLAAATAAYALLLAVFVLVFFGACPWVVDTLPASWQPSAQAMLADPRVDETATALRMFRASPVLGTGLTSYGELTGTLDRGRFVSYYAHDDYAQLLAETGVIGAGIGIGLAAVLGRLLMRFVATRNRGLSWAAPAAWAATAALAVHSFFDWNMHCPANALLAVLALGIAAGSGLSPSGTAARPRRPVRAAFAATLLLAVALLARDAASERLLSRLRLAIAASRAAASTPPIALVSPSLEDVLREAQGSWQYDPGNAHVAVLVGLAHVHAATGACPSGPAGSVPEATSQAYRRARRCSAVGPPPIVSGTAGRQSAAAWR